MSTGFGPCSTSYATCTESGAKPAVGTSCLLDEVLLTDTISRWSWLPSAQKFTVQMPRSVTCGTRSSRSGPGLLAFREHLRAQRTPLLDSTDAFWLLGAAGVLAYFIVAVG